MKTPLLALALTAAAHGAVISYQYDAAGRLTGVNYGGASSTAYAYDRNGSLISRANTVAPLAPLAAGYAGLIADPVPTPANSGSISLKLVPSGAFTGRLIFGGKPFSFKGTFATDGTTPDIVIPSSGPGGALTLHLVLDVAGGTNQITGTLADRNSHSAVVLDRASFDKKVNPVPGGIVGNYTVLLRPTQALGPQGFGYGTAKLEASGVIKLSATLPEGTKIAQSATVSSAGTWPFYLPLYKGDGFLSGLVTFAGNPGGSDFAALMDWQKPSTKGPVHPGALTTELDFIGSKYVAPPKGQRALDFAASAANARLLVLGAAPLDKVVTLDAANRFIVPADPMKLKLSVSPLTGIFSGSYTDGVLNYKVGGVLFQEQNLGGGMVLGATMTAPVTLTEP